MTIRLLLLLSVSLSLLVLGACRQAPADPDPDPADWTASLAFDRAAAGDRLVVLTPNGGAAATLVLLDGTQLTGLEAAGDDLSLSTELPGDLPAGPASVLLVHGDLTRTSSLTILAQGDTQQLLLVVDPGLSLGDLNDILDGHGVAPVSELKPLYGPGSTGDCLGQLALIDVPEGHPSVGELLAELEGEEQVWAADPKSEWGLSSVEPRRLNGSVALGQALPGLAGDGITIAVIDTGVAEGTTELGTRRLEQIDVLSDGLGGDPYRNADDEPVGHGTAVASLAAGATLGIAPGAQVLPVRVCDADGLCLASDVLMGVCSALSAVDPEEDGLVLNLSLGGDSEVRVLSRILESASQRGAVVVAAGGNVAAAPPHWPAAAAGSNAGLLAVGALDITGVEADFSAITGVANDTLVLPGVAELRAMMFSGNSFMRVSTGLPPAIELYFLAVDFELTGRADALRLVLQTSTPGLPGFSLRLGSEEVQLDSSVLDDGHVLQGDHLVQVYQQVPGQVEVLIDPVPQQFRLETANALSLTGLELVRVQAAAGGYTSGDYLSLAAPAQQLLAIDPAGNQVAVFTGTSFAAPQVAGAAALHLQRQLELTGGFDAEAVAQALVDSTLGVSVPADLAGSGRLDLRELLRIP